MFEKGNFVINTTNGICEIKDIVTMNMSGTNKDYYLLVPLAEKTAKIYIPVDSAGKRIRLVMQETDAWNLIKEIKNVHETYIENDKEREKVYKEALSSGDPIRLVGIIKTLFLRKKERIDAGKKNTALDEKYFKLAETQLHSELAFVLGVDRSNITELIASNL